MSEPLDTLRELGEPALAAFDVLEDKGPPKADPELSEAIVHLIRLRDGLTDCQRAGQDCARWLDRTNAMLSGVFGVEFPVGGMQWRRVCQTRDALREMLEDARTGR